jgi:hypothetical protein
MEQDLKEQYNEVFASADFRIANWDMHVKQSVWTFSNKNEVSAVNIDPFYEKQDTSVTTLVTTIKGHTRLEGIDFDLAYVYAHSMVCRSRHANTVVTSGRENLISIPILLKQE